MQRIASKFNPQEKKAKDFERANGVKGISLLQEVLEEKIVQDHAFLEQQEEVRIKQLEEARELDLETAAHLRRVPVHRENFFSNLSSKRRVDYAIKVQDRRELMKAKRVKRIADEAEQRRAEEDRRKEDSSWRKDSKKPSCERNPETWRGRFWFEEDERVSGQDRRRVDDLLENKVHDRGKPRVKFRDGGSDRRDDRSIPVKELGTSVFFYI